MLAETAPTFERSLIVIRWKPGARIEAGAIRERERRRCNAGVPGICRKSFGFGALPLRRVAERWVGHTTCDKKNEAAPRR